MDERPRATFTCTCNLITLNSWNPLLHLGTMAGSLWKYLPNIAGFSLSSDETKLHLSHNSMAHSQTSYLEGTSGQVFHVHAAQKAVERYL